MVQKLPCLIGKYPASWMSDVNLDRESFEHLGLYIARPVHAYIFVTWHISHSSLYHHVWSGKDSGCSCQFRTCRHIAKNAKHQFIF